MTAMPARRAALHRLRQLALAAAATAVILPAGLSAAKAAETPRREFDFLPLGDFTVNLPSSSRRMAYVVVSVTLETRSEATQGFKEVSPRLRQAVLRRLMAMSERQQLRPGQTDPALLRDSLYDSLAQIREDGLNDVVITRLIHS
jgi:flagellar basal body-associated protein FliL